MAIKSDIVDHPNGRTVHYGAKPKLGGLAIYSVLWLVFIAFSFFSGSIDLFFGGEMLVLFAASTLILGLGIFDDIKGANCYQKFSIQTLASILAITGGFKLSLSWIAPNLFWLEIMLTILWIVGLTNAMNLIDGLDGLATGIAIIAALILGVLGFITNQHNLVFLSGILSGCLFSFLKFNWNPAKIFLGDTGSLFLGFILACLSLEICGQFADMRMLMVPALIFAIPILDTSMALIRRIKKGVHPFRADKKHIHHRILNLGLFHTRSVLTLYFISCCLGAWGLVYALSGPDSTIFFTSTSAIFILLGMAGLRYFERRSQLFHAEKHITRKKKLLEIREIPALVVEDDE